MPARNAPFSITSKPMSSGNASRRTVSVNAPSNKPGDADRHVGAAKFRRDGVQLMAAQKVGENRQRQGDEQGGRNVQHLVNFAARVNFRGGRLAQQPRNDDWLADQIDQRHAVKMFRVMPQSQQRGGGGEQQRLQR